MKEKSERKKKEKEKYKHLKITDKMKETKIIAKAENFTATDFGKMSDLKDYTLELDPEIKIPGKVFGGQSVNATGGEFSFQSFAPEQGIPCHLPGTRPCR